MFDVANSLRGGLGDAQARLHDAQLRLARATAAGSTSGTDEAMASVARASIFTEALLAATKARLAEIKVAAK